MEKDYGTNVKIDTPTVNEVRKLKCLGISPNIGKYFEVAAKEKMKRDKKKNIKAAREFIDTKGKYNFDA